MQSRVMTGQAQDPCLLQGYIYIESYKESHVKDAVRGLRNIYTSKPPKLVPIKEMVDAITVNRKAKAMIGEHLLDLSLHVLSHIITGPISTPNRPCWKGAD